MLRPSQWRLCFQLLALAIFIFQMIQSVVRYMQFPVVIQTSVLPLLEEHKLPVIYICQESQFSYLKANENGYKYFSDYLSGKIQNTNHLGWMGSNESITAEELFHYLYETDYTDMLTQEFNNWLVPERNITENIKFLFPHGFCKEINYTNSFKFWQMKTKTHRKVLLVDPNRKNNLRTEENSQAWMSVGPTSGGLFEAANYEISIDIENNLLNDGKTCINYDKKRFSYGECIENAVKDQLIEWYNCVPVWFRAPYYQQLSSSGYLQSPPKNQCTLPNKPFSDKDKLQAITFQLWHLVINQDLECMKACLPPCMVMNIRPRLMTYRGNFKEEALLELVWMNQVTIKKATHSIEFFDLVVELGSALGLWLGLSAVSLLDSLVIYWNRVAKYLRFKSKY